MRLAVEQRTRTSTSGSRRRRRVRPARGRPSPRTGGTAAERSAHDPVHEFDPGARPVAAPLRLADGVLPVPAGLLDVPPAPGRAGGERLPSGTRRSTVSTATPYRERSRSSAHRRARRRHTTAAAEGLAGAPGAPSGPRRPAGRKPRPAGPRRPRAPPPRPAAAARASARARSAGVIARGQRIPGLGEASRATHAISPARPRQRTLRCQRRGHRPDPLVGVVVGCPASACRARRRAPGRRGAACRRTPAPARAGRGRDPMVVLMTSATSGAVGSQASGLGREPSAGSAAGDGCSGGHGEPADDQVQHLHHAEPAHRAAARRSGRDGSGRGRPRAPGR